MCGTDCHLHRGKLAGVPIEASGNPKTVVEGLRITHDNKVIKAVIDPKKVDA